MNNKGQALVEFVLILPIFIIILFTIIDFGTIINTKNTLENDSIDIVELIKKGEDIEKIKSLYKNINITITIDNNYKRISLEEPVKINTPGLNRILYIMNKLNNKGQSLVMFILIIPILLLIMILVIDLGNIIVTKTHFDNTNYLVIDYALDHLEEEDLESKVLGLINANNGGGLETKIDISNDKILVTTRKEVKGLLTNSIKIKTIISNYEGYIKDDKKIIGRV